MQVIAVRYQGKCVHLLIARFHIKFFSSPFPNKVDLFRSLGYMLSKYHNNMIQKNPSKLSRDWSRKEKKRIIE